MQTVKSSDVKVDERFIFDKYIFTKVDRPTFNAISHKSEGFMFEGDEEVLYWENELKNV